MFGCVGILGASSSCTKRRGWLQLSHATPQTCSYLEEFFLVVAMGKWWCLISKVLDDFSCFG